MKASSSDRCLYQAVFALACFFALGMPAYGQGVPGYPEDVRFGFDPREIALLPNYCIYTQAFRPNVPGANNPDEVKRWTAILSPVFNDMHHYCWGLMKTNRAHLLVRDQRTRTFYLRDSIQEFDYIINRVTSEFKLLPEILTKKSANLIELGRVEEGIAGLARSIAIKPDYWPPYAALSDYYKQTGDLAKARKYLEEGLAFNPGVKALARRMAELDGSRGRREVAPQRPETPPVPQSSVDRRAAQPQAPAEQSNERSN